MPENINVNTSVEGVQSQATEVTPVATPTPTPTPVPQPITEVEFDGLGKVNVNDVKEWKQGYMRQSDYTRKTQEIARQKEEAKQALEVFNYLKANPQVAQQLAQGQPVNLQGTPLANVNPINDGFSKMNSEIASLKLDMELNKLKAQYSDFDEVTVLQKADELGIADLEFVYKGLKATQVPNEAEIAKRIRAELTEQIRQNGLQTETIINTNDATAQVNHGLSADEIAIAQKMGLTPEMYAKGKA